MGSTPGINIPPPNGNQGQQPVTQPPPPKEISCTARYPADYCPQRSGNGICNPECNNDPCGFDGGDCDEPPPPPAAAPPNSYLPPPGQSEYGEVQSDYAGFD